MKYTVALLFLLLFFQCHLHKLVTYEQGLANCNEIQEKLKKDNPGQFHFVGPDCLIGSQIPDFEAISVNRQVINREMLKGKVSIINFWFISCAPCVAEIPGFNAIVDKYGTDNINYIAIGRDDEQTITSFLKVNMWKFEQIPSGNQIIQENFKIRWGYPTTLLLYPFDQVHIVHVCNS